MIDWNKTATEEVQLINQIAKRAIRLVEPLSLIQVQMDLEACHTHGCPLDLQRLLTSEPGDFAHDICGIARHLRRESGELDNCFVPRCAKRETTATV